MNGWNRNFKKGKAGERTRQNKNTWYFANLQEPICKQVWDLGQAYIARMQDPKLRPRRRINNTVHLVKLWYWLYLTGARQQEAFLAPKPELQLVNERGESYAIVKHVNQKHAHADGSPDIITALIPILDEHEQKMWNYITDGGLTTQAEDIFRYDLWKTTENNAITGLFERNFHTSLKDPSGKIHKAEGIPPHILRHMRAFNVLINHGVDRDLARIWFGWDSEDMLDYYAHIRQMIQIKDQLGMLRTRGLMTNLKIEAGLELLKPAI